MVKKILSLFLLGVAIHFCFGNTFFLVPTAYAEYNGTLVKTKIR